jgi:NAD(P)-dependent dehydrogenase (short-subunit alcohol dehydrogenase family)
LNNFNLKNNVAVVTGAAGMLGIEHSKALLEAGAKVIMTDINSVMLEKNFHKLIKTYPKDSVFTMFMDITSEDSILEVASKIEKIDLVVDILINNAAIDPKVKQENLIEATRLENFSLNDWNFQLEVGLTGAMLCSKVFGGRMAKNNGGVILNIASDLSVISPDQRLYKKNNLDSEMQPVKPISYSVIKHGLIGLTKYLATYWVENGVRCNALSPGGVYGDQDQEFVERLIDRIPMGRMANKNEYWGAIQFLCSNASSYMNGQNIVIDGGRSVI